MQSEDSASFHIVIICKTVGQNITLTNFTSTFECMKCMKTTQLMIIISLEINLTFKKVKHELTHSAAIISFSPISVFRAGNTMLVVIFT